MKRLPVFRLILIFSLITAILAVPGTAFASSPQTFTVLVGAENVLKGTGVMAYFPETLRIHVGDTVVWKQNTHEIHTVTFLAGAAAPALLIPIPASPPPPPPAAAGALEFNPQAAFPVPPSGSPYDGSSYANSGVMSTDPGQPAQYSLTFTKAGTFMYECLVHGMMMSGTIEVVASKVTIPAPTVVSRQAKATISQKLASANALFGEAMSKVPAKHHNKDGTTTYTVLIGWAKGQLEQMQFFPGNLVVKQGDTVNFILSKTNDFPHTVTFLNGAADIPLLTVVPNPPGPPILMLNADVVNPINPGKPLTRTGIFSSGFLAPGGPGPTSYTLKIGAIKGNITYECLLHDTSGMTGLLKVVP